MKPDDISNSPGQVMSPADGDIVAIPQVGGPTTIDTNAAPRKTNGNSNLTEP